MRRFTILMAFLLIACSLVLHAQGTQIKGKVTSSEDGSSLPGATVMVKGTTNVTVTDADGNYTLNVSSGVTALTVSFVGMKTKEVPIAGQTTINVILEPELKNIEEVVVTALGISREKKTLGYSVQEVNGDNLVRSGERDVISAMSAKVAGIEVISTAGTPGASSKILIRGNSTFTGNNQPLIVVDGIPINNDITQTVGADYPYSQDLQGVNNSNRALDINPDDIESVSVLKGPSAAALYGSKAASGAIIYTTKRGKAGSGPKVVYGFTAEISTVNKLPKEQHLYVQGNWTNPDSAGSATYQPEATPYSWGPKYTDPKYTSVEAGGKIYDNTKAFFKTGASYIHDISLSGGNENNALRVSLNRVDQSGIIPTSNLGRTTIRLNTDSKVTDKFTVTVSANYTNTNSTMVQNGSNLSGVMLSLMRAPISFNLADYQNPDGSNRNFYPYYDNPYWGVYNNPFKSRVNRFIGNSVFDYKVTPWLDANYRLGVDMYNDVRKQIFAIGANNVADALGQIEDNTITNQELYQDFILTADHKWIDDKLSTTLKLGGNLQATDNDNLYGRANQLNVPGFYNLSNGTTLYSDESRTITRTSSVFFDASLGWSTFLFVDITGRNDWSSTFGRTKNNFFYPAVSGSFIFSDLLPKNEVLSLGKLRAARAEGGKPPSAYSSRTYYVSPFFADGFTNGNSFPYLGVSGVSYSNVLGNSALKPEKTVETELGLDMNFFNSRIGFELTYYNKKSTDLLILRPLAGSSGFQYIQSNAGSMSNKGIELVLNLVPVKVSGFEWKINATYAKNTNKVLSLAEGISQLEIASGFNTPQAFAIKGQPYGSLYGTAWKRDSKGKLIIDTNGLPEIIDSSINLGSPYPLWTAGLRNTFSYKGLSLGILLDFSNGGKTWDGTVARMYRLGRMSETANREGTFVIPGVLEDGTANTQAISAIKYFQNFKGDGSYSATENSIYSTNWVRLREVTLSYRYDLKNKWFKFVEINITGRNLWLKTNYPGVDPETSLTGAGSNIQGFDYFNNPSTKSWLFGIRLGVL